MPHGGSRVAGCRGSAAPACMACHLAGPGAPRQLRLCQVDSLRVNQERPGEDGQAGRATGQLPRLPVRSARKAKKGIGAPRGEHAARALAAGIHCHQPASVTARRGRQQAANPCWGHRACSALPDDCAAELAAVAVQPHGVAKVSHHSAVQRVGAQATRRAAQHANARLNKQRKRDAGRHRVAGQAKAKARRRSGGAQRVFRVAWRHDRKRRRLAGLHSNPSELYRAQLSKHGLHEVVVPHGHAARGHQHIAPASSGSERCLHLRPAVSNHAEVEGHRSCCPGRGQEHGSVGVADGSRAATTRFPAASTARRDLVSSGQDAHHGPPGDCNRRNFCHGQAADVLGPQGRACRREQVAHLNVAAGRPNGEAGPDRGRNRRGHRKASLKSRRVGLVSEGVLDPDHGVAAGRKRRAGGDVGGFASFDRSCPCSRRPSAAGRNDAKYHTLVAGGHAGPLRRRADGIPVHHGHGRGRKLAQRAHVVRKDAPSQAVVDSHRLRVVGAPGGLSCLQDQVERRVRLEHREPAFSRGSRIQEPVAA
mmetsp:Transcript_19997/g.76675  ORF Transcript_19997/g.76675 Transcript_19997/m.76675 type:complete len:536 (-) Transcript_19997:49-1656(-)